MTAAQHRFTHVAIIGGGWAGMAAAVELASNNVEVTVYEAAKTLGGRARRVAADGVTLDNGLHILVGAYTETTRLISKVGQARPTPTLKRYPLTLRVEPDFFMRAPALPRPLHTAAALLFARGLALKEKASAVRFMRSMDANGFRCDAALTVGDLLVQHNQPRNLVDYLWNPLCLSALNTSPHRADAQTFLNVLADSLAGPRHASDLLLPAIDFTALFPEPAAAYVQDLGGHILTGKTVRQVQPAGDVFTINTPDPIRHSHVIVAVGPHRLEHVVGDIEALASPLEMVKRFEYEPIYSVYLQYDQTIKLPQPMIGIRDSLAQWVFDRGQLCGQSGMLAVVISASGPHQSLTHDELAEMIHQELAQRFDLPRAHWHQVIAEKRATFACIPGLQRPTNVTGLPGLFLAGDYTAGPYPATLEAAVRSGVASARYILADLPRPKT